MTVEYPLNFEEAIMSMVKDWEICECETHNQWRFNHEFSRFEIFYMDSWVAYSIHLCEQYRRWRVVK